MSSTRRLDVRRRPVRSPDAQTGLGFLSGLENGKQYLLQVACTNEVGTGAYSPNYTVTPSGPPSPPEMVEYDVEADPGNPGFVRMWVWVKAADGSDANTSRMQLWLDDMDWKKCVRYRGDSSPCLMSSLTLGQAYVAHLVAIDDANAWGPAGTRTIRAIDPPNAPSNVRADQGQGTALISWDASTAYQAETITYEIRDRDGRLLCSTVETRCSIQLPDSGSWTVGITAFNDGVPSPTAEYQGYVATTPPPSNPPVSPPPSGLPTPTPSTTHPNHTATPSVSPTPSSTASGGGPARGRDDGRTPPTSTTGPPTVRTQSITRPPVVARAGTRWRAPARTHQGQQISWQSKPRAICRVVKNKRVRFLKRGKCQLLAAAPAGPELFSLRKPFVIRVR